MALVTRLQNPQNTQEATNDITRNLLSLQFESALSDEERKLLGLRTRSHAISVTQCALNTVMVDIFKKTREMKLNLKNPDTKRTTKILQDEADRDSLIVGIIGCGRLGSQIAHCLLTYDQLHPSKLHISTRRPETLEYLQHRGVECYFNNERLISSVHVVIFCVLPSQMTVIAEEVKSYISSSLVMICPFSSLNLRRLRQMLGSSNVIRPVLHWMEDNPNDKYNYSINVNTALENPSTVRGTCPVGIDKSDLIVSSDERILETIILAVSNMCTDLGLTQSQTLTIIHHSVFGETHKKPLNCDRLLLQDFVKSDKDADSNGIFPFYDLVDMHEQGSKVLKRILGSESIQATFLTRYCHLFEDYVHKRAYGQIS